MEPKEVAPDSEMGRRPICRCLFAALGSIREVDHLTHQILASKMEQMPFVGAVYGKMTPLNGQSTKVLLLLLLSLVSPKYSSPMCFVARVLHRASTSFEVWLDLEVLP